MKELLLIRHAKSDWSFNESDFDRPLNARGNKNAPEMAQRLLNKNQAIDLFVSSPAKRAKQTALCFAAAYGKEESDLVFVDALYLPPVTVFEKVIVGLNEKANTVAIFSHNSGITDFANSLGVARIDNMPTCSVFAVKSITNSWSNFLSAQKEFCFFDYPKNINL